MPSRDWTRPEVEATVQDYLDMLACELRGEGFNKAAHNRALREQLDGRSRGAVERKHQNISAVLLGLGLPCIDGYKPLGNVQRILREAVRERLPELSDLVSADVVEPQAHVVLDDLLAIRVPPPGPVDPEIRQRRLDYTVPRPRRGSIDYLQQEARNQSLGDAGESLVMDYERARLEVVGKDHLARNIEQVSKTLGDQAGYDIHSYECNGRDRFIEVKTTRYGKHTPFYISAGELRFSSVHAESYHLYRLFGFKRTPKLFTLSGDVERHVRLQPLSYRAHL